MKHTLIIFLVFTVLTTTGAFAQQTFQRTIGGTGNDHGRAVAVCSTGGYLIVGGTNSFVNPSSDMYILKISDEGDFLWGKNIGAENHIEWATDVIETTDGSFLVSGYTDNTSGNGYDGLLVKLSSEGDLIWSSNFGGSGWDFFEAIETDEFGSIYLGGSTYGDLGRSGWLLKLDDSGELVWEDTIDALPGAGIYDINSCADGTYVFTGNTENPSTLERRVIGGRFDRDGEVIWQEAFESLGNAEGRSCTCTDGELKLVGNSFEAFGVGISDFFVAGFDLNDGSSQWSEIYSFDADELGLGIDRKTNGNLVICGARSVFGDGMKDAYVSELGPQGTFLGTGFGYTLGGTQDELLFNLVVTSDEGYIAIGEANSFGNGTQVYIVKVNAENDIPPENIDFLDQTTATHIREFNSDLNVYPNPAGKYVQFEIPDALDFSVMIYSNTGSLSMAAQLKGKEILNVSSLNPGMYLVRIELANHSYQQKLVILPH